MRVSPWDGLDSANRNYRVAVVSPFFVDGGVCMRSRCTVT